MKIRKSTEGRVTLVFISILFLLCLSAYLYVLYSVQSGASRIARASSMKENIELERERSLQLDIALRDNKTAIESLNELYIYENDTPKFIEKLETLAGTIGVKMRLSSLTSNSEKKEASLAVSLEISGRYQNIMRFIRSTELMSNYIVVNSLSFTKIDDNEDNQSIGDGLRAPTISKKSTSKSSELWSAKMSLTVLGYSATSPKK
ncbi:MAG: hypothetical protein HZA95_03815 [Candidatus Vogelbacteria bacterium]|nr:hypothetical protein [Candidatus Vogelbacteria bacterium]